MNAMITRRQMLTAAAASIAAPSLMTRGAKAAPAPLVLSDFGGDWATWNRKLFDTEFTRLSSVPVSRDAGADNAARIAKIKLGLSQKTFDMACFADSFFARAEAEGLLAGLNIKSAALTNVRDIDPRFVGPNYISHLFNGLGMAYNPSMVDKAPTAWADMWNPAYAGRIVLPTVNHSFGLHVILICALVASGDMKDITGALGKLKALAELRPIWALDSQAIMRSLSQGEAAIGWLGRGEFYQIQRNGGETKFVIPTEGGFVTHWAFAPVTNTRYPGEVEQYINVTLDAKLQADYATYWGFHPTNTRWVEHADKAVIDKVSFSDNEMKRLLPIDNFWFNAQRPALTDQWNRIVGA
jgi:putative spermidine/putrescine transport system substrate-binding protein